MRHDRADEQWMCAYAADDRSALGVLFDRYAHRLLGLYRHCLQDDPAAEELLQVTFAEVHRMKATHRAAIPLRTWLFGLAARLCLEAMQRERRPRAPASAAHGGRESVRSAVGELDGSARIVLFLHRYERMSFGEIAEVLGSSAQEVRAQAVRTYGSLQQRLGPFVARGEMP